MMLIHIDSVMGGIESKNGHRQQPNKHIKYKNPPSVNDKCRHRPKQANSVTTNERRKNETIVPLISSTPVNPNLSGSILQYSFPLQRAQSDIQMNSKEPIYQEILKDPHRFQPISTHHSQSIYDYRKHMERVDEENRPVLEGLYPDRMYVSTNDLRICDNQRLPPPIRCRIVEGFFRPVPPPKFNQKKSSMNASFL